MDGVVVRFAPVAEVLGEERLELLSMLTPAERARHDRLRQEADRAAYFAAHVLVRRCVAELLGASDPSTVRIEQHCADCHGSDHGRPSVVGQPEVGVSLAHARGHVAAMAAWGRCGIDVEDLPGAGARPVPREAFSRAEQVWLAARPDPVRAGIGLWVRKEALVKAGIGSLERLGEVEVLDGDRLRPWTGEGAVGAWCLP